MNKITLTLEFNSIEEANSFLSGQAAQPSTVAETKVASAQPSATVTPITAAPAPVAAAPAAVQTLDTAAKKAELMEKLRKLSADAQGNTQPIADFIHSFGVDRFSDLPEEQLPTFEANLKAKFGV